MTAADRRGGEFLVDSNRNCLSKMLDDRRRDATGNWLWVGELVSMGLPSTDARFDTVLGEPVDGVLEVELFREWVLGLEGLGREDLKWATRYSRFLI